MKILITGANGYLGQGIVKELINRNVDVIATDFSVENINKRAKSYAVNIFELNNPYDYFEKPDCVLHLAWRNGFVHNNISHIEDLSKHYDFLYKMISGGIDKLAVLGTMHEIGFYEGSINENTPTNPQSLYGIAKNALRQSIELLCRNNGVKYQWLRGFYIVGNTNFGSSIFSKITQAEKNKEEYFPFTSGQNQWDFIDYDEFCELVAKTITQDEIMGIINICSGKPEKLAERVERFIKENDYKIKLKYGVYPDRPYDSKAVWGDDAKINKIKKQ